MSAETRYKRWRLDNRSTHVALHALTLAPSFPQNNTVWLKGRNEAQRQQFGPQAKWLRSGERLENSVLAGLGPSCVFAVAERV